MNRLLCAAALLAILFVPATSLADGNDGLDAGSLAASEVTHDSARVTGSLEPGSKTTTWWVEYGASLFSMASTPPVAVAGDKKHKPVTVTAVLSGLPVATRVYARLVATSDGDRSRGPYTGFTTAAAAGEPAPAPEPGPVPSPPAEPPAPDTPPVEPSNPSPAPVPAQGESVVAAVETGIIRVRVPGTEDFVALTDAASVPVGSVVDARNGTLALTAALSGGAVQEGTFWGARFKVRQSAEGDGRTDLHLRGGFGACRRTAGGARTVASVARTEPKRVRRLWGKDRGGRFRTHGRDSVATVRGTTWSVTDRCDGTVTKVAEGAVDVRNRRTGRVVRVEAGERHFAKHRR